MASIKGIELKSVKTFRSTEYPTNYQGKVYFNGKNQGFWSQDGWGGPDQYDFDTSELDKVAKDYYGPDSIYGLECLLGELLTLRDYETTYKKAVKEGYASVVIMTDGYFESYVKVPKDKNKEVILQKCESFIKKFEQKSKSKDKIKVSVFTDLSDFVQ